MRLTLPKEIRESVFRAAYAKADSYKYLTRNRIESGTFLENLVNDPEIGGRLLEYIDRERVRTYIKDAILHRYSLERRRLPRDVDDVLLSIYPKRLIHEIQYVAADAVSLHRIENGPYLVVARTNHKKWETGLRRLVLYIARSTGLPPKDGTPMDRILIVFQFGDVINDGDRKLVAKGLSLLGVKCVWV